MHGPTGVDGVHDLPNSGQSFGLNFPLKTSPQEQPSGGKDFATFTGNLCEVSYCAKLVFKERPLPGIDPKPRQGTLTG